MFIDTINKETKKLLVQDLILGGIEPKELKKINALEDSFYEDTPVELNTEINLDSLANFCTIELYKSYQFKDLNYSFRSEIETVDLVTKLNPDRTTFGKIPNVAKLDIDEIPNMDDFSFIRNNIKNKILNNIEKILLTKDLDSFEYKRFIIKLFREILPTIEKIIKDKISTLLDTKRIFNEIFNNPEIILEAYKYKASEIKEFNNIDLEDIKYNIKNNSLFIPTKVFKYILTQYYPNFYDYFYHPDPDNYYGKLSFLDEQLYVTLYNIEKMIIKNLIDLNNSPVFPQFPDILKKYTTELTREVNQKENFLYKNRIMGNSFINQCYFIFKEYFKNKIYKAIIKEIDKYPEIKASIFSYNQHKKFKLNSLYHGNIEVSYFDSTFTNIENLSKSKNREKQTRLLNNFRIPYGLSKKEHREFLYSKRNIINYFNSDLLRNIKLDSKEFLGNARIKDKLISAKITDEFNNLQELLLIDYFPKVFKNKNYFKKVIGASFKIYLFNIRKRFLNQIKLEMENETPINIIKFNNIDNLIPFQYQLIGWVELLRKSCEESKDYTDLEYFQSLVTDFYIKLEEDIINIEGLQDFNFKENMENYCFNFWKVQETEINDIIIPTKYFNLSSSISFNKNNSYFAYHILHLLSNLISTNKVSLKEYLSNFALLNITQKKYFKDRFGGKSNHYYFKNGLNGVEYYTKLSNYILAKSFEYFSNKELFQYFLKSKKEFLSNMANRYFDYLALNIQEKDIDVNMYKYLVYQNLEKLGYYNNIMNILFKKFHSSLGNGNFFNPSEKKELCNLCLSTMEEQDLFANNYIDLFKSIEDRVPNLKDIDKLRTERYFLESTYQLPLLILSASFTPSGLRTEELIPLKGSHKKMFLTAKDKILKQSSNIKDIIGTILPIFSNYFNQDYNSPKQNIHDLDIIFLGDVNMDIPKESYDFTISFKNQKILEDSNNLLNISFDSDNVEDLFNNYFYWSDSRYLIRGILNTISIDIDDTDTTIQKNMVLSRSLSTSLIPIINYSFNTDNTKMSNLRDLEIKKNQSVDEDKYFRSLIDKSLELFINSTLKNIKTSYRLFGNLKNVVFQNQGKILVYLLNTHPDNNLMVRLNMDKNINLNTKTSWKHLPYLWNLPDYFLSQLRLEDILFIIEWCTSRNSVLRLFISDTDTGIFLSKKFKNKTRLYQFIIKIFLEDKNNSLTEKQENGEYLDLEFWKEIKEKDNIIQIIKSRYNTSSTLSESNLELDEIEYFMNFCKEHLDDSVTNNTLEFPKMGYSHYLKYYEAFFKRFIEIQISKLPIEEQEESREQLILLIIQHINMIIKNGNEGLPTILCLDPLRSDTEEAKKIYFNIFKNPVCSKLIPLELISDII